MRVRCPISEAAFTRLGDRSTRARLLLQNRVAVEKLTPRKVLRKTLR